MTELSYVLKYFIKFNTNVTTFTKFNKVNVFKIKITNVKKVLL